MTRLSLVELGESLNGQTVETFGLNDHKEMLFCCIEKIQRLEEIVGKLGGDSEWAKDDVELYKAEKEFWEGW